MLLSMPTEHHVGQYGMSTKLSNICLSGHMSKSLGKAARGYVDNGDGVRGGAFMIISFLHSTGRTVAVTGDIGSKPCSHPNISIATWLLLRVNGSLENSFLISAYNHSLHGVCYH